MPVRADIVQGDCLEIIAAFEPGDATSCGVMVRCSPGGEERTLIVYDRVAKRLTIDRDQSSLDPAAYRGVHGDSFDLGLDERLTLHIFLDRSIVEVYANERACLTARIYPSRADSLGVSLFSRDGRARVRALDAWELGGCTAIS